MSYNQQSSSTGTGSNLGESVKQTAKDLSGQPSSTTTTAQSTSTQSGGGVSGAFQQLGQDISSGVHKAAQAVGLEEKPLSSKLSDDAKNIKDSAKVEARKLGH